MTRYIIILLACLVATSSCTKQPKKYWYLAAELTIGLNRYVETVMGECHMKERYDNHTSTLILTGYGLMINVTITNVVQRFVAASAGAGDGNKLSIMLFTTHPLTKYSDIDLTIMCLEEGDVGTYTNQLPDSLHHNKDVSLTILGSCVTCVNMETNPLKVNPHFKHPIGMFMYDNTEDTRGSYGVTFEDELNVCFLDIKKVSYDLCYRQTRYLI
ncbi:gp120-like protein [Myxoma virus]|nr:gp120-like protein [Myxoma virus]AGU99834.1 gp120-like protein [Myxoma virus]